LPIVVDRAWLEEVAAELPELPWEREKRFQEEYGLPEYDARVLTTERALADYFEAAVKAYGGSPKAVANLVINHILRLMNEQRLTWDDLRVTPERLAAILRLVDQGVIHKNAAKKLMAKYRAGKKGLLGWFVGQVMRETRGKANPQEVQAILRRLLEG